MQASPQYRAPSDDPPLAAMLAALESLGDNCELGMVQRRHGVEPLDLFRWSATDPAMLIDALNSDLEGIADPQMLVVETTPDIPGRDREYVLRHRRFSSYSHTFARVDHIAPQALLEREVGRLKLLRRKFLADSAQGRRLYVFRSETEGDEAISALARALRRRGPNVLLAVRPTRADRPAGSASWNPAGWIDGRLETLAPVADGFLADMEGWTALVRQAFPLWIAGADASATPYRRAS